MKNNKIKSIIQAFFTDLLFWIYVFGCSYFLIHSWFEIELTNTNIHILIAALVFTLVFLSFGMSLGRKIFSPTKLTNLKWKKTFWGWTIVFLLVITFVVGWNLVEVNPYKFFTQFKNARGISSGIFDPSIIGYKLTEKSFEELRENDVPLVVLEKLERIKNKSYTTKKVLSLDLKKKLDANELLEYKSSIFEYAQKNSNMLNIALSALAETIFLALLATIFAIPFAFVLSFLAARNLMPKTFLGNSVYLIVRTIATIFRSIEAIVWAIIFSVWVGIGPFAGMLALMIHSIAALTKLYSEQIENIDEGPVEAIKATGANTFQVWIFAVIPQIISPYLAFTIYRWDINVRMATIVGFVGGGGIGLLLLQQQQLLRWHNVGVIIWLIAAVVWIMDMTSAKVRAKLVEM
ncbi:MAG: phosphonate ABC transporter, permease protein PhnE [Armatimonadetes bacterium]|nr:phosphonate ABC transporter, permease protein PhnE [Armatimonadota bacterium]